MANYLEEAAAELRKARQANESRAGDRLKAPAIREERMRIAEAFTRLAAIERCLLPPEMVPVPAGGGQGET